MTPDQDVHPVSGARNHRPVIAIVGSVGIPAKYGGFETLVENLVRYHARKSLPGALTVYCSSRAYADRPSHYEGAELRYIPLDANGISSVIYDAISIFRAIIQRADVIMVLGVSGALILPVARLFSRAKFVVNIDGLEWRREKWSRAASLFLKFSERLAVHFADTVIADNGGIVDHVAEAYGAKAIEIPYGGDNALLGAGNASARSDASPYSLMLCRIEPENNVHLILAAFAKTERKLVAVGNWQSSAYGRSLADQYRGVPNIKILDPVYEPKALYALRHHASAYIHGHSAGGTNPSLVEMMILGKPVLAYDCVYNRYTTENSARYFDSEATLATLVNSSEWPLDDAEGLTMRDIASRRYTWDIVGRQYFDVMLER
ncbi:DUF1972 domain-containing protein [Sphingomonadaceae bacterium jetA1]|jgi:glycosyltransferase involved in cell wall biosynthesis|uniref:DUF1972 domain-containing protein n=1 Tax=Facivitalis istanbulensis TaxID=3075838 RepID=UPI0034929261